MAANMAGKVPVPGRWVASAKDQMTIKEFLQVENRSVGKLDKMREPAQKLAAALLK